MTKHPIVRIYEYLNEFNTLTEVLNNIRKTNTDEPLIFTFEIPEDYHKSSSAPFIRITPILLKENIWSDNDSKSYRFYFAIETFSKRISDSYLISELIIKRFKEINGVCYSQDLSKDTEFDLYNNELKFEITLEKGQ
ncbi:hypothetical protein K1Y24_02025 [Mammaliicoccus sciuri]|uniref:hypothetical protein n=1 Tax=Mammaliicoccus sciuri TaxID=1296 RepID=UPI001E3E2346|nr:hypothetical protein [Mammaliicoccus sciuri]MCD8800732.1 hypothetical protein [Mammaliicoccus sciuri]